MTFFWTLDITKLLSGQSTSEVVELFDAGF
jgi:hypothetical protein